MAEFGISMDGRAPVTDIPAQAKAAEEGGASTLWIACHLYLRDPISMAALALGAMTAAPTRTNAMNPRESALMSAIPTTRPPPRLAFQTVEFLRNLVQILHG